MSVYIECSEHISKGEDITQDAPDMQRALNIIQFEYNAGLRAFFLRVE